MNDDLQTALAVTLKETIGAAKAGVTFLQAELPEVIRQLLMWKAVESFVLFVVMLVLFGFLFRLSRRMFSEHDGLHDSKDLAGFLAGVGAFSSGLIALMCTAWLKILIAPKVYLIEYAASLVK